ncbi:MAG: cytochrome c [Acidobacteriota bacterium]
MKRALLICFALSMSVLPFAVTGETSVENNASTAAAAEVTPPAQEPVNPAIERGRYLVENVAMCGQCHSGRTVKGKLLKSDWLGGAPVPVPMPPTWAKPWAYRAPRIAGLPQHTDEEFVTLMTTGVNRDGRILMLPMPPFRMTEEDATAIAAYLRTLR